MTDDRHLNVARQPETPAAPALPRLLATPERPQARESAWRNLVRWLATHPANPRRP